VAEPRLSFHVHTEGTGPYVFMVHGMLSSRLQWMLNLDEISRVARPVVFELWGHGRSPAPDEDRWYDVDAYLEQFDAVRQQLGVRQVLLCGQSLGAALTLRYSALFPENVTAQVFTNSVSGISAPLSLDPAPERSTLIAALESRDRGVLSSLPFHPGRARRLPAGVREQLVREADSCDPRAIAKIMQITGPQLSVASELFRVKCPTLLVNGAREVAFQGLRDRVPEMIEGCEVVDLDAGHAVNIEAPVGFNRAVTQFFARIGDDGAS